MGRSTRVPPVRPGHRRGRRRDRSGTDVVVDDPSTDETIDESDPGTDVVVDETDPGTDVVVDETDPGTDVVEDETDSDNGVVEEWHDNRSPRGAFRGGHHGTVSTLARAGLGPVFGKLRSQGYGGVDIEQVDGQIFISAERSGEVRHLVYDAATGALVSDVSGPSSGGILGAIASKLKQEFPGHGKMAPTGLRADGRGSGKSKGGEKGEKAAPRAAARTAAPREAEAAPRAAARAAAPRRRRRLQGRRIQWWRPGEWGGQKISHARTKESRRRGLARYRATRRGCIWKACERRRRAEVLGSMGGPLGACCWGSPETSRSAAPLFALTPRLAAMEYRG